MPLESQDSECAMMIKEEGKIRVAQKTKPNNDAWQSVVNKVTFSVH